MNKYVKIRKIGEGAFGKADLVKQKSDGQQYVVKEINIIKMGPKEREDARKEVAVLAQLKHPNIVTYRESFEEHGVLHIVMDYCAGGDLYAKITNQRGILFSEEQILDWFVQMCLAIKHIHDRKILHRDIKSQNIFLTSRGQAQLGDFGIAKVLNSTVELARTCIGTPYYLSPEICENKPYNNKSDIWSLGCVIYEVATLKHAFEAGNMKNLVLKIIRGTYPPMSPKYSYELRGLVSQLFKRTPRDRPSVNTILKKPFISQRVSKFLTDEQVASEFSHTVMHGQKLGRALPPPPKPASRPPSASKRAEPSGAVAASAVKRYDPSKIYGAPVAKKSKENRVSVDVNKKRPGSAGSRPGSAAGSRPSSAAGARPGSSNQDVQKKRQDLLAKERQRRDDMQKREYERKHKELQEKQKISRIKKSQEEGWKSVLGSLSSEDGSNESKSNQREEPPRGQARWQPPAPAQEQHVVAAGGDASGDGADRGRYEHYHQHLDKMQYERHDANKRAEAAPAPQPAAAYMAAPRPLPVAPKPAPAWRQAPKAPAPTPMYQPYNQRANEQKEERSKLVDDFIQRKREAAMNRQRGNAELFGQSPAYKPLQKQIPANHPYHADQARPSSAQSAQSVRNREEQEYLDRLRQIRYQNYNERRNQGGKHPEQEAEERKKKGDALKRQAEDWAKQRKDALEGKRRDLMEKERRLRDIRQIGEDRPSVPAVSAPAVPMTGAMNAIGAQPKMVPAAPPAKPPPAMTGIVEAIGATPRFVQEEKSEGLEDSRPLTPPKTPIQKQKEEILRKLNQKGPPKGKWGEDKEPVEEPKDSVRPKWGAGGDLKIALEDPESARSKWGQGQVDFGQMSLEETASHMEVTSARDRVIVNPESARRQWGKPGETVLNVLQGVPLAEATIASNKSDDSGTSSASSSANQPIPGVGSTITISKNPIRKGTITIRTAEENKQIDISTANQNLPAPSQTNQNTNLLLPSAKNKEIIPVNVKTDGTANETIDESVTDAKADISPAANQDVSPPSSDVKEPLLSIAEQIEQSFSDIIEKPPIPVKNPPVPAKPEKPLLLPKPVLLPKPDAPMQFGSQRPAPGKSLGAGSLFEKVVLEEQDEDERSGSPESLPRPTSGSPKGSPKPAESPVSGLLRTPSPKSASPKPMSPQKSDHIIVREIDTSSGESDKPKGGLALGITMGTFDMRHTNLLRTCSEPDLTNLFKSLIMETPLAKVKSMDDMTTVDEEDDDAMAAVLSSYERVSTLQDEDDGDTEDKKTVDRGEEEGACEGIETQAGEEEEDVDEDEDDLADLLSVRETMQSLLIDDSEDDNKTSPVKFNISSDQESRGDTNDGDVSEGTEVEHGDQEGNGTVDQEGEGGDEGDDEDGGEESPEGQESGGETGEAEGNWELDEARDIGDGVPRSTSLDNENPQTPDEQRDLLSELFPTDEDSDSEFQDEAYEDFDLFGRLEESRAELEVELGAEKLIRVYKTVQALQEDEDENIEEGARIATDMLGKDKEHLYPKIFQLVMADAAFTDDNLS